jgi:hypothetical protein
MLQAGTLNACEANGIAAQVWVNVRLPRRSAGKARARPTLLLNSASDAKVVIACTGNSRQNRDATNLSVSSPPRRTEKL